MQFVIVVPVAGLCACQDMVQRLFSEAIFRPSQLTTMLNFGWLRAIVSSLCLLYYMVSICKCIYIYMVAWMCKQAFKNNDRGGQRKK